MEEIWKDITGYEGYYQISNFGRVKSLSRKIISEQYPKYYRNTEERILKQSIGKRGYFTVTLKKDGIGSTKTVHRLIALEFIPNPNNFREINHINCDKLDNDIINLEWVSPKENTQRAWKNGRCSKSPKSGKDKYDVSFVLKIKEFINKGYKNKDIAEIFSVKPGWVSSIRNGYIWSSL